MQIIPSIDLASGKVVRLTRGRMSTVKEYSDDPVGVAQRWEMEGVDALHVVDLDAALHQGSNLDTISKMVKAVQLPVQVGGGVRKLEQAMGLFAAGAERVVLGTLAFSEPKAVLNLLDEFGGSKIVVALDYLYGRVMVEGWRASVGLSLRGALERFLGMGVKWFLLTSIRRDGTLMGPDFKVLAEACRSSEANILASGGIGSLEDLLRLKELGVRGAVIGKAIYEGRLDLREAIKAVRGG